MLLAPLCLYQADATIVNVATPAIRADLGASGAELQLVVAGYLLASAMLLITGARLGELRGQRRMFLAGLGLFGAGSLACGLAPAPVALIAARVVQGVGGALLIPQVLAGILRRYEGQARARALGLYSAALAGGAVAGQALGGVVVAADVLGMGWRPVFLLNVPIVAAVLVAAARGLPPDGARDPARRLDVPGVVVLAAALMLVMLPLTLGSQQHWPAWAWLCLATGVPLLGAFALVERRAAARTGSPLLDLTLLRRPAIARALLAQALAISTYYGLLFSLAQYLQQGLGRGALFAGLVPVAWVAAFGVPGRLLAAVPARARRLAAPAGCLLMVAAYAALSAAAFAGDHSAALFVILLGVGGLGLGTAFSAVLAHVTAAAGPARAADISGAFTTGLQVAGAIGVAAFGATYLGAAAGGGADAATHAFAVVTAAFALTALAAAVLARAAIAVR